MTASLTLTGAGLRATLPDGTPVEVTFAHGNGDGVLALRIGEATADLALDMDGLRHVAGVAVMTKDNAFWTKVAPGAVEPRVPRRAPESSTA